MPATRTGKSPPTQKRKAVPSRTPGMVRVRDSASRSRLQSPSRKRNEADARKASDRSRLQAPKSAARPNLSPSGGLRQRRPRPQLRQSPMMLRESPMRPDEEGQGPRRPRMSDRQIRDTFRAEVARQTEKKRRSRLRRS